MFMKIKSKHSPVTLGLDQDVISGKLEIILKPSGGVEHIFVPS